MTNFHHLAGVAAEVTKSERPSAARIAVSYHYHFAGRARVVYTFLSLSVHPLPHLLASSASRIVYRFDRQVAAAVQFCYQPSEASLWYLKLKMLKLLSPLH